MGVGCKKIVELFCKQTKTWNDPRGIRTPNLRVWNPTRCHCAMESPTVTPPGPWPKGGTGLSTAKLAALSVEPQWRNWTAHQTSNLGVAGSSPAWGIFGTPPRVPSLVHGVATAHGRQHVRVVKESDLKSDGLCPRRFKSCCCRFASSCTHFLFVASACRTSSWRLDHGRPSWRRFGRVVKALAC